MTLTRREKGKRKVKFNALKGVEDILLPDIRIWQDIESEAREIFSVYGYSEIRIPVIEPTGIFTRSIGETTDIVEKEMYTFPDRAGRSITLRPEGTASVVRSYVENHLYNMPAPQKFFYSGPMFRYERPQKGRFRQFYQIGVEAFGVAAPEMDAEVLSMLMRLLGKVGLTNLNLEINSIGCEECRPSYKKALIEYFCDKLEELCPDCKRRYYNNPLRILDCKVERCIALRKEAPQVTDFICDGCRSHFENVLAMLQLMNVSYTPNPNLVRGLDYYTSTTFEITSEHLGSQKAVAAGGRYDRLVSEFGGPATPSIGFAIGIERLAALLKDTREFKPLSPEVFIATIGKNAVSKGLLIAEDLRSKGVWVEVGLDGSSLKSQLRKADRISSHYAFIIGDDELSSGKIKWKKLTDSSQGEVEIDKASEFISSVR